MNAQRINTTISYEQWQLIQKNNWKYSEVIKAGISALVKPDVLMERLQAVEAELEARKRRDNTKRFMSWSKKNE